MWPTHALVNSYLIEFRTAVGNKGQFGSQANYRSLFLIYHSLNQVSFWEGFSNVISHGFSYLIHRRRQGPLHLRGEGRHSC
ncbi:hypothetical protein ARTHRO9V_90448 [Arthrobacter sp. 9V]|nr:hypothetical protein ARTHRO9V_90448 [Arthrobacter sp. 9V]